MGTGAEVWVSVAGFPGYEVSSEGRVHSLTREVNVSWRGKPTTKKVAGRELTIYYRRTGTSKGHGSKRYGVVRLSGVYTYIHRLVAETFLANPENLPVVRHLDDDPTNNKVSNLCWGTYQDNTRDMMRNGNHYLASRNSCLRGHLLQGNNCVYYPSMGNARACKACGDTRNYARKHKLTPPEFQAKSDELYRKGLENAVRCT